MATVYQGVKQFQGAFGELWRVTSTVDFGNAATGSGTFASVDIAVPNVALGDIVMGVSLSIDTIDTVIAGAVTAAGVVTLTVLNNTAGAVDHASCTANFVVARPNWV